MSAALDSILAVLREEALAEAQSIVAQATQEFTQKSARLVDAVVVAEARAEKEALRRAAMQETLRGVAERLSEFATELALGLK